ncbi:MAG: KpsF/GutQ family sugar-phosphate isomerase [Ruminococcus flavefaciens]|nr:KpsF/GutQ family sugar-phosphate isomerase [Ruminococcus flavefaciens]
MDKKQKLAYARNVFDEEISALTQLRDSLDDNFTAIEEEIIFCKGKVVLCGMGKSGHIARKISATLSSLGTPSLFLHPAEALHGDLGMVSQEDIVFLISHSGETDEIVHLLPSLKIIGCKLIGITGKENSTLARECHLKQIIDVEKEACSLNLAPTSSTTSVLVYGDALAVVASVDSGFGESDFGLYHPAGTLGKRVLIKVRDIMATEADIPVVKSGVKITDAIMEMSKKELGVIAIVDSKDKLTGILTDGDLRRAIEQKADLYGEIVDKIMTTNPKWIRDDILIVDALQELKERRLNNFPVVDDEKHVIGMLTWQMIVREGIVL